LISAVMIRIETNFMGYSGLGLPFVVAGAY